ncbi:MAG: alcohol dehydrogenase catalytic domain-containing protein [Nitrosomonas sp.]|nr:alcohol dehydrogenase catalytic domain-containing protein [Nitrosomonas sp.]
MSPIHNHDLLIIRGIYGFKPTLPYIGGSEALAIVEKLGENVTNLAIGDRVIAAGISSAWGEYFIADVKSIIPIPDALPDEIAAQLVAMPISAMMALNKLKPKANEWIIVNAANGAVGKTIIQIAVSRDIRVACLVTRAGAKLDLENCGASDIFIITDSNLAKQLNKCHWQ